MNKKSIKTQTGNIQINKIEHKENYAILSTYHLKDNRLTLAESGLLTKLLILPNNWKITKLNTSKYFNLSRNGFKKYINNLVKYGYIEITKQNNNNEIYKINEIGNNLTTFNVLYLKSYSINELNYFLNSKTTEPRYKNAIKKYLKTLNDFEKELNTIIEETENK